MTHSNDGALNHLTSRYIRLISDEMASILGLPQNAPLDPRLTFFDLGLDSNALVELQDRLSGRLGYEISESVAYDNPSVADLADHLARIGIPLPTA